MDKKKPNFKFPKKLLEQVNECSEGGFVLFLFDSEGFPEVHIRLDDPKSAMCMQSFIINWSKALNTITSKNMIEHIQRSQAEEDAAAEREDGEDESEA